MENQVNRTIVRYANRKLYDKTASKCVTLEEIAKLVKTGEKVTILDNVTKIDITNQTLFIVLVDNELSQKNSPELPIADILQAGGLSRYVNNLKGNSNE